MKEYRDMNFGERIYHQLRQFYNGDPPPWRWGEDLDGYDAPVNYEGDLFYDYAHDCWRSIFEP